MKRSGGHPRADAVPRKRYGLEDLLAQVKPKDRHEEADWGKPEGKEVW